MRPPLVIRTIPVRWRSGIHYGKYGRCRMVEFIIGVVIGFLIGLFWDDIRGKI